MRRGRGYGILGAAYSEEGMGSGLRDAHEEKAEKTDETTGKGLPEEALRHLRHGLSHRRLSGGGVRRVADLLPGPDLRGHRPAD